MNNKQPGSIPRKTMINDQPHMLAYINPREAMLLKSMGGTGQPGPGNIPAFPEPGIGGFDFGEAGQAPGGYYGGDFGEAGRTGDDANQEGFSGGGDQAPAGPGFGSPGFNQGPSQTEIDAQNAQNAAIAAAVQNKQTADLEAFQAKVDDNKAKNIFDYMPLSMLGRFTTNLQNQEAIDQLSGKKGYNPGLFDPGGFFSGKNSKSFSHFSPVTDSDGNLVGSASISADGSVIGYRGDRTSPVFGPEGIQEKVDAMNAAGQGGPDSPGGSEGPPPIIVDDEEIIEDDPDALAPYVIQNLDIIQPTTLEGYEVPSIYKHGGIVSLDPFKQLARNNM